MSSFNLDTKNVALVCISYIIRLPIQYKSLTRHEQENSLALLLCDCNGKWTT